MSMNIVNNCYIIYNSLTNFIHKYKQNIISWTTIHPSIHPSIHLPNHPSIQTVTDNDTKTRVVQYHPLSKR